MSISTRSLKKCVPSETSGTRFSRIATISQSTATVSISENDTGTPSIGMVVPQRPGPASSTRRAGDSLSACRMRPMRRATA